MQENAHGFVSRQKRGTGDFGAFFDAIVQQKKSSAHSTYVVWDNAFKHFTDVSGGACTFALVDSSFVERSREYLLNRPSRKSPASRLSPNTVKALFERFISVVKSAHAQKLIPDDPTLQVKRVK